MVRKKKLDAMNYNRYGLIMFNTAPKTQVARRSAVFRVPALTLVPQEQEPELEPLIPAEPSFNRTAYEMFLEGIVARLVET